MAYFHTTVLDNQIKALPTVDTASGSVATFDTDMTENLISCVCEVASGSSEINVYLYGTNYVDMNDLVQGSFNINNGNDLASTTRVRTQNKIPVPSGTYNIFNAEKYEFVLYVYDENDAFIDGESLKSWQPYGTTITVNANRKIRLGWRKPDNSTMTPSDIHNAVCTSTTDSTTVNIPFGETLSGDGSFDVLSGILTRSDDTTKQLSANYIQTTNGENNIWCDTGDTEVKFLLTVGKKIA